MATITIPEDGNRGEFVIYGNLASLNFFLDTDLEPDEYNTGRERRQKSNKAAVVNLKWKQKFNPPASLLC